MNYLLNNTISKKKGTLFIIQNEQIYTLAIQKDFPYECELMI